MTDHKINPESEDIFPHIINMIKNRHLAIFLGSGACKTAGLPLACELRDKITSSLGLKLNQNLTLEQLLQQIKQKQGTDAFSIIVETLQGVTGPPKGYHSIAALVKHGFIRILFTTNYDNLLEIALSKVIGNEFVVVSSKQEFDTFTVNLEPEKPILFKLHGSIDDESSILGAWDEVQIFSKEKMRTLLPYFQHYGIVFIGYACGDEDVSSLIKHSLENRRDRKSYTITLSSETEKISEMLTMLNSTSNHIEMSSDHFLEELLRRTMKIDELTGIPLGVIESNAKEMFSREIVQKMRSLSKEEFQKQDIDRLEQKIRALMESFAIPISKTGLTVYRSVRKNTDWAGRSNFISLNYIESIMQTTIKNLHFVLEFEFEIRVEAKNEPIMPILFSLIDLFLLDDGRLIAMWSLFISDAFPYGQSLGHDHLNFSWSEDGFLNFEAWVSKKLNETIMNMKEAGSGKKIKHDD